jgi:hypothetical protein
MRDRTLELPFPIHGYTPDEAPTKRWRSKRIVALATAGAIIAGSATLLIAGVAEASGLKAPPAMISGFSGLWSRKPRDHRRWVGASRR